MLPEKRDYHIFKNNLETFIFDVSTNVILKTNDEFVNFLGDQLNNVDEQYLKNKEYLLNLNKIGILTKKRNKPITNYVASTYKLSLEVFSGCNLRCIYCYGNIFSKADTIPTKASFSELKKAIDYFIFDFGKDAKAFEVNVVGGGEPLLNFKLIKEIREYCDSLEIEIGKKIVFWVFTNGTVFSDEIIDFFVEKKQSLTISLDGPPEIHNYLRPLPNSKESFFLIEKWIKVIKEKAKGKGGIENFWASAVITSKHDSLVDIIELYYSLGIKKAQIRPIRTNNKDLEFNQHNFNKLHKLYYELVKFLIDEILNDRYDKFFIILNDRDYFGRQVNRILLGQHTNFRCGAGKSKLCVRANGNIYPCDIGSDKEALKLGECKDFQLKVSSKYRLHVDQKNKCSDCWARYLCGGGCLVAAYDRTGSISIPDPMECEIHKVIIQNVIIFIDKLRNTNEDAILKIKKYIKNQQKILKNVYGTN